MSAREQANEAELMQLGLSAPRVTPGMVDRAIQKAEYTVLQDGRTTICLLTLDNGFTVRGESSCVNGSNFNAEFGQRAAYDDARRHVWAFLAFRIAERRASLEVDTYRIKVAWVVPDNVWEATSVDFPGCIGCAQVEADAIATLLRQINAKRQEASS